MMYGDVFRLRMKSACPIIYIIRGRIVLKSSYLRSQGAPECLCHRRINKVGFDDN